MRMCQFALFACGHPGLAAPYLAHPTTACLQPPWPFYMRRDRLADMKTIETNSFIADREIDTLVTVQVVNSRHWSWTLKLLYARSQKYHALTNSAVKMSAYGALPKHGDQRRAGHLWFTYSAEDNEWHCPRCKWSCTAMGNAKGQHVDKKHPMMPGESVSQAKRMRRVPTEATVHTTPTDRRQV